MTGHTAANLIVLGNAGLWIVAIPLAVRAVRARYLRPSPDGFALRRPWEQCALLSLIGFLCLLLPLVMASNDLSFYGAVRPNHRAYLWAFAGIGLAGAALFWWVGRPEELAVDEERRSYHWSVGWPPLQRVRTGPLSDLEGVWAESGYRGYLVYVGWRGGTGRMEVGRFQSSDSAVYYADELAAVLGVLRLARGADWRLWPPDQPQAGPGAADARPLYRRRRRHRLGK
jgi:hypothetical protein